jgi:4-carboxymuconolactone decarboxylase
MTDQAAETAEQRWQRGLDIVNQVYGAGSSEMMKGQENQPFVAETVNHVFADIWAMPHLSIRDKRLLVIGASTMLGRSDLLAIQIAGAIVNGELTEEQLGELPRLMLFYAGAGNTTALFQGIMQAKAKAKDMKKAD